ncbi:MAG: hypothetical protein JWR83_3168 [Aeromicrobium sp.]|nr:hypothetical protein [Aeromicrobium sp.]
MALLALVALVLGAVIVMRVSAGADPAPQDTSPIVINTPASTPASKPTSQPTAKPTKQPTNGVTQIAPPPREIGDDGHHQRGKGTDGGGGDNSGEGSSGGDN